MHICKFLFRCLYYRQLLDIFRNNRAPYTGLVALTSKTQSTNTRISVFAGGKARWLFFFALPSSVWFIFFTDLTVNVWGQPFRSKSHSSLEMYPILLFYWKLYVGVSGWPGWLASVVFLAWFCGRVLKQPSQSIFKSSSIGVLHW